MFINLSLSHSIEHYCEKIDNHIKEDFETKIPDYGAEAFNPIGFHFKRRGERISGIYRSKNAKMGGNAFVSQSTHMHFKGRLYTDKAGQNRLRVILWPQTSQIFFLLLTILFPILLAQNFADTYIYVIVFAVMFIYSLFETIKLFSLVKKEMKEFFK